MSSVIGGYSRKLDAKGRLSLPADFRKVFSEDLVVTPDPLNQCLYVFEADAFPAWIDSLFESKGGFNPSDRLMDAQRKVLNFRAQNCELDASGRINLSQSLREGVGIEKDVCIFNNTDHLEIWDEERWNAFMASIDLASLFS